MYRIINASATGSPFINAKANEILEDKNTSLFKKKQIVQLAVNAKSTKIFKEKIYGVFRKSKTRSWNIKQQLHKADKNFKGTVVKDFESLGKALN